MFTGYGPLGYQDITLGIDASGDGTFEELLPKGINDLCFMQFYPGGVEMFNSGPGLTLKVEQGRLAIGHPTPQLEYSAEQHYAELKGASYGESTLQLADIRRDSDGDGFSDHTERLLLLNPRAPDSDGDGLDDAVDPTPNANPQQMGPLERGVARALAYYYAGEEWSKGDGFEPPYTAELIKVQGAGPVALAWGGRRTICVASEEQYRQFGLAGGGLPGRSGVSATVGRDEHWQYRDEGNKPAPWGVALSFGSAGAIVELKELDGDYYPVRKYDTWIS